MSKQISKRCIIKKIAINHFSIYKIIRKRGVNAPQCPISLYLVKRAHYIDNIDGNLPIKISPKSIKNYKSSSVLKYKTIQKRGEMG